MTNILNKVILFLIKEPNFYQVPRDIYDKKGSITMVAIMFLKNQSLSNIDSIYMFSCDHCKYQIASTQIMDIHNKTFHDKVKKYDCDICGYQVSHKNSLVRHKKI